MSNVDPCQNVDPCFAASNFVRSGRFLPFWNWQTKLQNFCFLLIRVKNVDPCQKRRFVFASFCRFVSKNVDPCLSRQILSIRVKIVDPCLSRQILSIRVKNVDPCLPRQILSDRDGFYLFKIGRLNCTTFVLCFSVSKTSIRVKNVDPCFCVATQVDFGKFLRLFVRPKLGLISTTCNTFELLLCPQEPTNFWEFLILFLQSKLDQFSVQLSSSTFFQKFLHWNNYFAHKNHRFLVQQNNSTIFDYPNINIHCFIED